MNANIHLFHAVAVNVLVAVVLSGCGRPGVGTKSVPLPVVGVEETQPVPFARELALTGEVVPVRVAKLSSFAEGPVTFAGVREGDRGSRPGQNSL